MTKRKAKWFKTHRYPEIKERGMRKCEMNNHTMLLDSGNRTYIQGTNERYTCMLCHMEMFIQMQPSIGYGQLHGTALSYHCTKRSSHDGEV